MDSYAARAAAATSLKRPKVAITRSLQGAISLSVAYVSMTKEEGETQQTEKQRRQV